MHTLTKHEIPCGATEYHTKRLVFFVVGDVPFPCIQCNLHRGVLCALMHQYSTFRVIEATNDISIFHCTLREKVVLHCNFATYAEQCYKLLPADLKDRGEEQRSFPQEACEDGAANQRDNEGMKRLGGFAVNPFDFGNIGGSQIRAICKCHP